MKKWVLIISYIIVIVIAYLYRGPLLLWIEDENASQIPLSLAITTFVAIFPVVPFTVAAGVMGAKYGIFVGGLINIAASTIAAVIMFALFRFGFATEGRRLLTRWPVLDRFTSIVEKNAFIAVLFARLIPIVPAPAVNLYSAISRMPISAFTLASFLGKIPVMIVFAVIGDQLFTTPINIVYVVVGYSLFIYTAYLLYRRWSN